MQPIFDDCKLDIHRVDQVHGGDINEAYCLITSTGKYFLKVNSSDRYPGMFEKEASGLDLLRQNSSFIIPGIIKYGVCFDRQYLLLEWMEKGMPAENLWESYGAALALLHQQPGPFFGLEEDNYIGRLVQINTSHDDWPSFYKECRVMPLVKKLFDSGAFTKTDLIAANNFCDRLKEIFPGELPSLLHGDLWSGNHLIHSSGNVGIFDPAVYFGHREIDIGMTKLFGGFDQRFYNAYNEIYPLEKDWQQRLPFSQLYPVLVHAVLFGGHYVASAKNIIASFK